MLRLYTTEQPPSVWGGVDRPVISYTDDLGQTWKELQPCSDITRYQFNRAMRQIGWTVYDFRYLIYHSQWYRLRSCHLLSKREADHPALFPDVNVQVVDSGASYVPFANFDSNYLYWCTDGEQLGGNFVMVIEGTAPLTATGLFEGPRPVWNVTNYSTRYWSFAAADVFVPGPTYSSLTAQDMENFYGKGWDRRYKIVGATSRDIVKACGLDDPHALFLPYKNELMNNNPPAVPAVIEREMLARHMAMGLPSDKQSIEYVTSNCGKENKCLSIDFMKASLGDQYPSLQVYTCDVATGIKTPFVYQPYRRDSIRT
ncbi:hypothetical protein NSK_000768 [Nannochloropsis salina CCMP1776]|uniref:Uncharacterized protein n=1 Tax=Nannochloropsis salina CCMP1776 TaxID=1027361 RepID=A0A4D9DHV9_9STRA|nr:hypothetical protein NSK_000768 [Nannochloropsis salina CCMP1776]|eukprot:TFJ88419.1 hypothetical protein NSK_000768 [Nannochloropsis salina CCMP1776]